MSAFLYWKERLLTGMPFFDTEMYVEGVNFKLHRKNPDRRWPHSVARSAIYADYCIWHTKKYLPEFAGQTYYQENPGDLPTAADELGFFSTLGPWLYVVGKGRQVRSYMVNERKFHSGTWHDIRRKRYFVRLCSLEVHMAAFELYTGVDIAHQLPLYEKDRARIINCAQKESRDLAAKNRASMPSMI